MKEAAMPRDFVHDLDGLAIGMAVNSFGRETVSQAARHIERLELALHQIVGHGNITVERAKQVARQALEQQDPNR